MNKIGYIKAKDASSIRLKKLDLKNKDNQDDLFISEPAIELNNCKNIHFDKVEVSNFDMAALTQGLVKIIDPTNIFFADSQIILRRLASAKTKAIGLEIHFTKVNKPLPSPISAEFTKLKISKDGDVFWPSLWRAIELTVAQDGTTTPPSSYDYITGKIVVRDSEIPAETIYGKELFPNLKVQFGTFASTLLSTPPATALVTSSSYASGYISPEGIRSRVTASLITPYASSASAYSSATSNPSTTSSPSMAEDLSAISKLSAIDGLSTTGNSSMTDSLSTPGNSSTTYRLSTTGNSSTTDSLSTTGTPSTTDGLSTPGNSSTTYRLSTTGKPLTTNSLSTIVKPSTADASKPSTAAISSTADGLATTSKPSTAVMSSTADGLPTTNKPSVSTYTAIQTSQVSSSSTTQRPSVTLDARSIQPTPSSTTGGQLISSLSSPPYSLPNNSTNNRTRDHEDHSEEGGLSTPVKWAIAVGSAVVVGAVILVTTLLIHRRTKAPASFDVPDTEEGAGQITLTDLSKES